MAGTGFPPGFAMGYGHRMPEGPVYPQHDPHDANRAGSDWQRLSQGRALGKSINIVWDQTDPNDPPRNSPIPMVQIQGPEDAAVNMVVTLAPPLLAFRGAGFAGVDIENFQGPYMTNDQFQVSQPNARLVQPVATIEWGTLGVQQSADVDFVNGVAINLSGSFVRVSARLVANETNSSVALYRLGASISQGRSKDQGAQRTLNFLIPAGAAPQFSSVFAIPRFAKRLNVNGGDSLAPDSGNLFSGIVRWWNSPTKGGQFLISSTFFNSNQHDSIDVPAGAYYFDIQSDGSAAWNVAATFGLSI